MNEKHWVCMDCVADPCVNGSHAWTEATRIEREDGSEAWLAVAPEPKLEPDVFEDWVRNG
jgi:hypothetical protein